MTEVNAAKSVIHKAVELHRSFERVLPKDASDRDKKLTEVFLVYRKGSLSVVRKKSLWGILLRLHQFFFRSSSPLSLSKSWSEAISLMAELAKTNVRECQKCIANEKVETGFTIERLYQGLEKELSSIKRHVEKRAKYSAFAKVPQKMPLPADHRENRKQLLSFLERRNFLKQKNLESFINELPDPNPLLEEIVSDLASDEEITTALSHALLRAITLTNDTKKTEGYEALLRELSDVSQTCSGSSTVSLKEIGLVFGDHFIGERCLKENGKTEELAGDYSSVPYARLLGSFLDQYKEMTPELMKLKALFRGAIDLRKQPSVQELKKEIERQIRDPKASSCLLLGGWQKHSICYEIEKQSNGKYAFRVYNKGGGIEFHQSHMPNYSKKRFPCVAVKDIPKKDILSSAFLGGLKNIIYLDKKRINF